MPDNYTLVGIVFFGLVFIVSGVLSITRKQITFTYQRGTIKPAFEGTLRDICARIYGIASITGGAFMIIPLIYAVILKNPVADGSITFIVAIGVGIFIVGLIFRSLMQALLNWGESLKPASTEQVSSEEECPS